MRGLRSSRVLYTAWARTVPTSR